MSSPGVLQLSDELGPRGRRRVRIATAVSLVVLGALAWVALRRFDQRGQLDGDLWRPFTEWSTWRFLLGGLTNTVKVSAVAMVLALVLGGALALLRLAQHAPARWLAGACIEFFRGIPLILLIFFCFTGLRSYDIDISPFQALVLALTLYNGAVLGEVFRAGIRSLDRGQSEAAFALGLGYWAAMRLVVVPQAVRRMVPAIVSQLVTLLKDSSLGFIITYEELTRRARSTGEYYRNFLQTALVAALIYITVNLLLGRLARWLEVRQRRRLGAGAMVVVGAEDVGSLAPIGEVAAAADDA